MHASALLKPSPSVQGKIAWAQNTDEVLIQVPVDPDVRGRDVEFEVHRRRMSLRLNVQPVLEGSLADAGEVRSYSSITHTHTHTHTHTVSAHCRWTWTRPSSRWKRGAQQGQPSTSALQQLLQRQVGHPVPVPATILVLQLITLLDTFMVDAAAWS
jgi:hypothetical protein